MFNVYYWADIALKVAHIVILTLCIEIIYAAWIKEVKFCLEICRYTLYDMMVGKEICGCILQVINMNNVLEIVLYDWFSPPFSQWC